MLIHDALARRGGPPALFGWPRVRVTLLAATVIGLIASLNFVVPFYVVVGRVMVVGFGSLLAFGLFERWPARLPRWFARWVLQVLAIVLAVPLGAYFAYWLTTGGHPQFGVVSGRLQGYFELTFTGILFAPWIAVGALVRQRDTFAREQEAAFALERSELERRALDARFRLLQAQVEPHFLFNTLANVQALVEVGAPQAVQVLKRLIAYLRAAVPQLHETVTTLDQELELVRAYLELMHMRMPDRLIFEIRVDQTLLKLRCPPMTLLTLVENAVRHGIDPSETGGTIVIEARLESSRCLASVTDTGVGLKETGRGLGTGLASLHERLQLAFGAEAQLVLSKVVPPRCARRSVIPSSTNAAMTAQRPTALIAEDEPLLRESLEQQLSLVWPQLAVVARARNGREAIEQFDAHHPEVCFLDVHMPGVTGIEAARHIGHRAHLVFVTAYDQYAVQAFAQGVLDYLVKPVDAARLAQTAARLQERLRTAVAAVNTEVLLQQLATTLEQRSASAPLRWIRASVGQTLTLIPVPDIDFLRAEEKYTVIAWHEAGGMLREAVIRTPLKELAAQLDATQFAQVHRSVIVNWNSIARVVRGSNETADVHLKGRAEVLPVSRSYLHLFRQM